PGIVCKILLAQAEIDSLAAEFAQRFLQRIIFLDRAAGRTQTADCFRAVFADNPLQPGRDFTQGIIPADSLPDACLCCTRMIQSILRYYAVTTVTIAVRQPGFVDGFIFARNRAPDGVAQNMQPDIRTGAVVWTDRGVLRQFPGACVEAIRFVVQRADR